MKTLVLTVVEYGAKLLVAAVIVFVLFGSVVPGHTDGDGGSERTQVQQNRDSR